MELKLINADHPMLDALEEINKAAYPPCEYIPLKEFYKLPDSLQVDVLAMTEGDQALGFTVLMIYDRCVYIFYLAVDEKQRSRGLGSQTLRELPVLYPGCQIVVDFEVIDPAAPNNAQRIRRTGFYRRCGFTLTTLRLFYMETEFVAAWMGGDSFDRAGFLALLAELHRLVPAFDPIMTDKPIITEEDV